MIRYELWDACDHRGVNIFERWTRGLQTAPRAKLNQKLDMLERVEFNELKGSKVLNGPINKTKHIYKLRIQSEIALRPLLCRGPVEPLNEYTLLCGAIEKGSVLPKEDVARAEEDREAILKDHRRRRHHVRVT